MMSVILSQPSSAHASGQLPEQAAGGLEGEAIADITGESFLKLFETPEQKSENTVPPRTAIRSPDEGEPAIVLEIEGNNTGVETSQFPSSVQRPFIPSHFIEEPARVAVRQKTPEVPPALPPAMQSVLVDETASAQEEQSKVVTLTPASSDEPAPVTADQDDTYASVGPIISTPKIPTERVQVLGAPMDIANPSPAPTLKTPENAQAPLDAVRLPNQQPSPTPAISMAEPKRLDSATSHTNHPDLASKENTQLPQTAVAPSQATAQITKESVVQSPSAATVPQPASAQSTAVSAEQNRLAVSPQTLHEPFTEPPLSRPHEPARASKMATEVAPPTATAQVISPTALNPATETSLPALMEVELPSAQMTNPALSKPVSPQAAAPSTASSPQVAEQVSAQISAALKSEGGQSIEIRLDPEELGRVRIVLSGKDGSMNVAIFSEKPEVLDLMRRHSDRLETDFADIGYEGAEFTFQQEDDDSQHSQQSQTGAADIDASQTEMTTPPLPSASGGEARLDLRF